MIRRHGAAFLALGFMLIAFHMRGLDWGTPTAAKTAQVLGGNENLIPRLLELRQTYQANMSPLDRWPWGKSIPPELVMNAMRGFLLGVPADDQQTLSALSAWKPWRGQWDPMNYTYGAFYFAGVGTALLMGKITGALHGDLSTLGILHSPDLAAALYRWARGFSAILNGLSALLLYGLLCREGSRYWALGGAALFLTSPLVIVLSHLAKPHAMGVALILLGLWLHQRQRSPYAIMACFGLSAACLVTNFLAFAIAAITLRHKKAIGVGLLLALAANYPVVWHMGDFIRNAFVHHIGAYHQGTFSFQDSFVYARHFLIWGFPWLLFPVILWGWKRFAQEGFLWKQLWVRLGVAYACVDILIFRHHGIALFSMTAAIMLVIIGLQHLSRTTMAIVSLLFFIGFQSFFGFSDHARFARSGHLTDVGAWMNAQLPAGSSIGILANNITPATVPSFSFLQYSLSLTPIQSEWPVPTTAYLVGVGPQPALPHAWSESYSLLRQWPASPPYDHPFLMTHENVAISLWEKRHAS